MFIANQIFQGQLIEKQIRSITFIVWVLGRVEKNAEKGKNIFFVLNQYQCVTHVSTTIFQELKKNIM